MQPLNQTRSSWWTDLLVLSFFLGCCYFILLGSRPLFVPDEGRYAEIAREMVASGDYLTPHLNNIKYFEKPVFFYWLQALAIKIGGLNLWSLRSVNGLLGLLGCLLTYCTARMLYDRTTGLLAAATLGTSLLYFIMTRMISLDLPVTVFLMLSLYAFLLGTKQTPSPKRRLYFGLAASAAALAVLTKGLIGVVFPLLIIGCWMLLTNEWRQLKQYYLPSNIALFLLIATPWHLLVGQHNPEFFYFYFIDQHFLRYTTMDVGHYQPAWFFIPNLIFGFFPWVVFLPQAIVSLAPTSLRACCAKKTELFLLLWAILVFAFFSFSKSKLIPYILPIFPPLAILTARYLCLQLQQKPSLGIKWGYAFLLFLSTVIACALYSLTYWLVLPNPTVANTYLYPAATILFLGALSGCFYVYKKLNIAITITVFTSGLFSLLLIAAAPAMDARSILPLVFILKPLLQTQDEVVTFNQYYQDLPFYLERRVSILNWRNELSYGMQHQDTRAWMLNDENFWQHWHSKQRLFVIMGIKQYQELPQTYPNEKFYLLGRTLNNALVTNHATETK